MKFILLSVFLSVYGVVSLPIQSIHPHHDAKDVLHLFKKNPMELVSMMQNVDPAQLQQVISLLEGMLTDSKDLEAKLQTKVNDTSQDLAQAVIEADNAKHTVDKLNEELTAAELTHNKSLEVVDLKEDELSIAEKELNDQHPSLIQEQKVLRQVIEMLENLSGPSDGKCSSHSECSNTTFCHDSQCVDCSKCHFNDLAIDGNCPLKCPSLCEPAVYPKCPLCTTEKHCEAMAKTEVDMPTCEDGSGKCPASSTCRFEFGSWEHKVHLVYEEFYKSSQSSQSSSAQQEPQIPGGGDNLCKCISDQIHCIMDENCLKPEDKADIATEETKNEMTDFCENKLGCSPNHCEWVTRAHKLYGKSFINNKLTHMFPHLK